VTRRATAIILATVVLTLVGASAALGAAGVYAGDSPKATRHMDITIQVLSGGRRANWRIDVFGPCTEDDQLSRTVGTDAGNTPPDRPLRLRDGRFALSKHATSPVSGLTYTYRLTGHAVRGGFVGTFHYHETDHRGYSCDVPLLHWSARHTTGPFP
jgi:hypothetical protein